MSIGNTTGPAHSVSCSRGLPVSCGSKYRTSCFIPAAAWASLVMEEQMCATKEVHRPAVTHREVSPVLSQGLPVTLYLQRRYLHIQPWANLMLSKDQVGEDS